MGSIVCDWLYIWVCLQVFFSNAESYECKMQKDYSNGEEYCVFSGVVFDAKNQEIICSVPPTADVPKKFAFENSTMKELPPTFWQNFGVGMTHLKVENCSLQSISITSNMKALYAPNNVIRKVIVNQNEPNDELEILDLNGNNLESVQNITRCRRLQVLHLSDNQKLLKDNVLDLSVFAKLNELRELYLANIEGFYLDNTIGLRSLELLDLSRNNWIPSDLDLAKLSNFTSLHTLRLNDNNMDTISYAEFLELKSLKTVYLNGNGFKCSYLKTMLEFLQDKNIATPTERSRSCQPNQKEVDGMCCQPDGVWSIEPSLPPPQTGGTSIDTDGDTDTTPVPEITDDGYPTLVITILVITAVIIICGVFGKILQQRKRTAALAIIKEETHMV